MLGCRSYTPITQPVGSHEDTFLCALWRLPEKAGTAPDHANRSQCATRRYPTHRNAIPKSYDDRMSETLPDSFKRRCNSCPMSVHESPPSSFSTLDERDDDVKAAWVTEIARRSADAETNPDDEEDWRSALEDVRREVLAR